MAEAKKKKSAEKKQRTRVYNVPELGVSVEATDAIEAAEKAKKLVADNPKEDV